MQIAEKLNELEAKINGHKALSLDPILEKTEFITERTKLYELLLEYTRLVYHKSEIDPSKSTSSWGSTVIITAAHCLKIYDARTDFLHLFNATLSKEFKVDERRERNITKGSGLKISNYEANIVSKLDIYFQHHPDITYAEFSTMLDKTAQQIADALNVTVSGLKFAFEYLQNSSVASLDLPVQVEDDEVSLMNIIPSQDNFTDKYDNEIAFNELIAIVDNAFCSIRKSTQPLISFIILNELILNADEEILNEIKEAKFFNIEFTKDIISHGGYAQKDISEKFKKSPANVSQIYKRFTSEVKAKIA